MSKLLSVQHASEEQECILHNTLTFHTFHTSYSYILLSNKITDALTYKDTFNVVFARSEAKFNFNILVNQGCSHMLAICFAFKTKL